MTMLSFSMTRGHNADGTGNCWIGGTVNGPSGTSMSGYYVSGGADVGLDRIPRYLSINSFNVSSRGLNSVVIAWGTSEARDITQYSLNGGAWIGSATHGESVASNQRSGTFNIKNLSPNTSYSLKIRCKATSSQLWTESTTITFTTYDIAKISSADNFELGEKTSITITNPASATAILSIRINNVEIKTQNLNTGTNTIQFTDEELDSIYKQFTNTNTVTVTYVLITNNNQSWTNTKTAVCTLTGNQKTAHIGNNGENRRAKVFVCINGEIKRAVVWAGINGTVKRCI